MTIVAGTAVFLLLGACIAALVVILQEKLSGNNSSQLKWKEDVKTTTLTVMEKEKDTRLQLVIARYAEDLSYLLENDMFLPHLSNTIIYNKGEPDINEEILSRVKAIRILPNVGRCDHTYLHHIVEGLKNNTLAHRTVFLPGSCLAEDRKVSALQEALANRPRTGKDALYEKFVNFSMSEWKASASENAHKNPERELGLSAVRPFGKWLESVFGKEAARSIRAPIYYGGVFSATARALYQQPLSLYETLLEQVSLHSNPEVGHYIERLWGFLITAEDT